MPAATRVNRVARLSQENAGRFRSARGVSPSARRIAAVLPLTRHIRCDISVE